MFIIHWMFDKLGYMPKIDMHVGKVNIEAAWPFPEITEKPKPQVRKPVVKKTTTRKTLPKKAK